MARPTVMTPEVLGKLEDAYLSDATHLQAAIFAGIDETTLHDYRKKHPEFSQRIDELRGMTCLKAKVNIRKAIVAEASPDKGVSKSQWYLERRDPDFKAKSETKHSGDISVNPAALFLEALRKSREVKE